ncbi:glycosyltransferase [Asaia bogorensis]|uniref:glycosyltransferase n=1 Tax=Asaia bogorensis TaxID=91915 RepID=UPI000EFBF9B2|nr:glycosyltransferase [Asaia bogorensis]
MNRPLRIALVAHPRHPIAEPFKGGMEAHSFHLARGLMARGHDVTLFAAGDSDPAFTIDPLLPVHYDRDYPWENTNPHPELYTVLDKAFGAARHRIFSGQYDIVHNNSLHRFVMQEAKRTGLPCVTSLHVPPFDAIHGVVRDTLSDTHHVTVTSARQNISWWGQAIPPESLVVHNGIDMACWPFSASGGAHAIWCGRITRNKGPHLAIAAAKRANISLRLFGYLEDRAYFDQEIAPELGEGITYGGVLEGAALSDEMQQAALLLFTPCWDEPFGLIAVEAMASGLPVASFDQGAVREVIGEEAGRYAAPEDVSGLSVAIREALDINRSIPRHRTEAAFSHETMIDRYEVIYGQVMNASQRRSRKENPYETLIL